MKKVTFIFLLGCVLVLGIMIGKPSRETASRELQDELGEFEDIITIPDNDYSPVKEKQIDPNISNSLAKRGENIISGFIDFSFSIFEDIIS